jgi:transcriptional regulator with XRE-family HTH domain
MPRNLGQWLQERRAELEISQAVLADWLSVDHTLLSRFETGERPISNNLVAKIAAFLMTTPSHIRWLIAEQSSSGDGSGESWANTLADLDRKVFAYRSHKDSITSLRDVKRAPDFLCGLRVAEDEDLFGPADQQIYAGLYPEGIPYRGKDRAIVVATQWVKKHRTGQPRDETLAFQILHELGHYRAHWQSRKDSSVQPILPPDRPLYCSSGDSSPLETEANVYAAAFLLPKDLLIKAIGGTVLSWRNDSAAIAREFFVSRTTLRYRLKKLGIHIVGDSGSS